MLRFIKQKASLEACDNKERGWLKMRLSGQADNSQPSIRSPQVYPGRVALPPEGKPTGSLSPLSII